MAKEVNDQNFNEEVLNFKGVVLVDFWAPWCGPCQMLGPIIEEISEEFKDKKNVKVCKVNVDESSNVAQQYGIMSIPALKFFKDGEVVEEMVGLQSKDAISDKLNDLVVN